MLRGRYEPPAARRGSQVRPCRLLAALRSKSGVWPLLRSRQHCLSASALIVRSNSAVVGRGFRLPRHSSTRLGCRLPRAGAPNPPATRQAMAGASNCGGFSLLLRRLVRAVPSRRRLTRRPARGGPRPALVRLGGPPPLRAVPAPCGRAPPGSSGLRFASGERCPPTAGVFFGYRVGGGGGGWGRLTRPLRPRPSSAWRALRDPPASVGRVRAAAATPIAYASLDMKCLGSPKKTAYATGFPLPTSAEPVFFGNPPCDISHRD